VATALSHSYWWLLYRRFWRQICRQAFLPLLYKTFLMMLLLNQQLVEGVILGLVKDKQGILALGGKLLSLICRFQGYVWSTNGEKGGWRQVGGKYSTFHRTKRRQ
jgi:hypothetical protein